MRSPCHDVCHQRSPSSPRHLPQLVRRHRSRTHRPSDHRRSQRHQPRPNQVRRDNARRIAKPSAGYPSPLQWDCFRFAIIQRADHFTFCVCIDHLHTDATLFSLAYAEIHVMYATVTRGGAPISLPEAGSYHAYCVRQRRHTSALTLESAEVREWIEFSRLTTETFWTGRCHSVTHSYHATSSAHNSWTSDRLSNSIRLPIRRGPVLRRRVRVHGACRIRIDRR